MSDKFQPGDRFILTEEGRALWSGEMGGGRVVRRLTGDDFAGGAGESWFDKDGAHHLDAECYAVRFDEYGDERYGTESNHHAIASRIMLPEVSDDEVADAIQSILKGAS